MPLGRPKVPFDLPEGWDNTILTIYSVGGSDFEVKAAIHSIRGTFSNDLWDRWMKEESIFSETIKVGRMLCRAWWEKEGRMHLQTKEFSSTLWYMNMKNRFGWRDRQDITSGDKKIESNIIQIPENGRDKK